MLKRYRRYFFHGKRASIRRRLIPMPQSFLPSGQFRWKASTSSILLAGNRRERISNRRPQSRVLSRRALSLYRSMISSSSKIQKDGSILTLSQFGKDNDRHEYSRLMLVEPRWRQWGFTCA